MDHVADKVHEEPHESVMDHVGVDTEGFLDRPQDASVLTSYADYMVARVWAGKIVIWLIITY